ncbi:MLV-related proviral Env polyprotein-like [Mus caroli]|uniref:MLV-related proviral Env polyprotein-like n=1 Tax=Mus caroli TaxID=10089 RepID=A0A6P5PSI6_MUSCR|nr:MLV-related proviral Env polyprotein-like [Mus caroli]
MTGQTANATSLLGTQVDAFPTLSVDLCDLVGGSWDPSDQDPSGDYGCQYVNQRGSTREFDFYVCPGHKVHTGCGGPAEGYCRNWGCETTGQAYWNPSSTWDFITVKRGSTPGFTYGGEGKWKCKKTENNRDRWVDCGPCYDSLKTSHIGATPGGRCNPLIISFTEAGKKANWDIPKSWGLRLYRTGPDPVLLFSLTRIITNPQPQVPIGPNPVLADQKPPSRPVPVVPPIPPYANSTGASDSSASVTSALTTGHPQRPGTGDRLLDLVQGAYLALNLTSPERTQECWLCLVSGPPYYEGVAVLRNYSNYTTAPANCSSLPQHKLTLPEVSGQGRCIGKVPPSHQALCNVTESISVGSYYLAAPAGTLWACNTGLTPCLSAIVLNLTSDYCVLVEVWPKVTYYPSEYIYTQFEQKTRFKREPVSLTLALLLGGLTVGGIAAGIGTGATALTATQQFMQLQAAMHTDLQALEDSVTNLEKSLTSLSEVVLQNRRGLDLLFLKEGGLCAALKEECCFYADHTGLVRDSMAKLRERLKQRQKIFDSQQGWFEGLFNRSPWFTTLISTITGPLIILMLILFFGPCILNRLVQLIKDRVSVVQALVLTQQYHQLKNIDPEEVESSE